MADREHSIAQDGMEGGDAASLIIDLGRLAEVLLDEQKSRISGTGHGIAGAFRQAAATLEEGYLSTAAGYAERAAGRIDDWAGALRRRNMSDLVVEVERFARREPAIFTAGAVAAGFLLGRFFFASAKQLPAPEKPDSPSYAAGSSGSLG